MQTETRKRNCRLMAMTLAGAGIMSMFGGGLAQAAPPGAEQVERTVAEDRAQQEVDRAKAQQQKATKQAVRADKITVPATSVQIEDSKSLSEKNVRSLVPELNKDHINIHKLSKQIQMVNDTGAAKLGAKFVSNHDGTFAVKVANEAKDNDKFTVSVANNGTEYSGDWRATLSYLNNNLSKHADTFGMAYVTSPDSHFSDVKMGAFSYRRLLPKTSGALTFSASVYDIQQEQAPLVAASAAGLLDTQSSGKGTNIGLHYQHYLSYTSREKNMWDFGLDYRQIDSTVDYLSPTLGSIVKASQDYSVLVGSVGFVHNNRDTHHSFTYNLGVYMNINGDDNDYNRLVKGSGLGSYDTNFVYYQAGLNYQVRSNSDWIFGTRLHAQYTNNNLVGLVKIGAGGMNTVRGFENCISADKGIVGNVEVFTPEFAPHSRFVAFYDYGNLSNNNSKLGFGNESLASVGLGYRYNNPKSGISLSIDYAHPVDDVSSRISNTENHRRWNAMLSVSF